MVVVKSRIKEMSSDCNVSGDFAESLNKVAVGLVKQAAERAKANGRKTVQAKDVFVGKVSAKVMLVSKSKAKEAAPKDMNMSGDFAESLNELLAWHVNQAQDRAKANGRKTISPKDL